MGSGSGISAWRVKATDVSITDGAYGIIAQTVRGKRVTVDGNDGLGVRCDSCRFRELTATNNGDGGIEVWEDVMLRDSVLTGNDGLGLGIDILAYTGPPIIINTICGRSGLSDGTDWNFCTDD